MASFVRSEMLPEKLPPVTERGVVKWLRENLFSNWLNTILTLMAVYVLYYLAIMALPWLIHGVWKADSLGECRAIIAANFGPDASGACWAVIRARWYQWIFGFYPPEIYWRPILNFGLLFVAMTPILYSDNQRTATKLVGSVAVLTVISLALAQGPFWILIMGTAIMAGCVALTLISPARLWSVTAIYPFLTVFMLWGGSVWGPLMAIVGFVILGLVYRILSPRMGVPMATGIGFVVACIWWFAVQGYVSDALQSVIPLDIQSVDSDKFGGFLLAFLIGVSSISISLPIGILLALGRQSNMLLIKALSVGLIEFVRGVPLITMLFTASLLLQYFLPPQVQFDLILRVVILVTFFSAAYNAENVRGGLAALPKGQFEAADALGLDYWQAQRLIIMPQALKVSIPSIVSTFIGLFKDTTLVTFVGLAEPLRGITTIVRSDTDWKGIYWEPYIFVGAIFFAACYGMSRYSTYLERKLKTDHR
ncbi:MAG: amino acid ABC transporter permease [Cypionkella sp.]